MLQYVDVGKHKWAQARLCFITFAIFHTDSIGSKHHKFKIVKYVDDGHREASKQSEPMVVILVQ